jgi:heptosyltransferase-2
MRVAILKPDHLGDLVLAAPAIAAIVRRWGNPTLLCHPETKGLAHHLFPGLATRPILFPHLDRTRKSYLLARPLAEFDRSFDLLLCLRWDSELKIHLCETAIAWHASEQEELDIHVAVEQREAMVAWTGPYDLLDSYLYPHLSGRPGLPQRVEAVGLCISAGFPLNSWPLNHWLELAHRLRRRNVQTVLIGGPSERSRVQVLAKAISDQTGALVEVLCGGPNFGDFLQRVVNTVDLVVATDSGTAHLVSLVRPVLSLFGGSPWRRFAPLGAGNAIVTRQLPCSPCPQFDRSLVNTCVGRECLANLLPAQVEACLDAYLAGQATVRPKLVDGVWLTRAPWEYSDDGSRKTVASLKHAIESNLLPFR